MSDAPRFYEEAPCAHGCGRTSIVKHADGRVLCRVCYQAEVGMDGPVPGCPTCDADALQHRARETWWALCHMSYTGDQPDLRKQDVEEIASLIRDLAASVRDARDRERERAERAERVVVAAKRAWANDQDFPALVAALREYEMPGVCPVCDGIGAQSGAHTERVESCPNCFGTGYKKVIAT